MAKAKTKPQPQSAWRPCSKEEYFAAPHELRGIRDIGDQRLYYLREKK